MSQGHRPNLIGVRPLDLASIRSSIRGAITWPGTIRSPFITVASTKRPLGHDGGASTLPRMMSDPSSPRCSVASVKPDIQPFVAQHGHATSGHWAPIDCAIRLAPGGVGTRGASKFSKLRVVRGTSALRRRRAKYRKLLSYGPVVGTIW